MRDVLYTAYAHVPLPSDLHSFLYPISDPSVLTTATLMVHLCTGSYYLPIHPHPFLISSHLHLFPIPFLHVSTPNSPGIILPQKNPTPNESGTVRYLPYYHHLGMPARFRAPSFPRPSPSEFYEVHYIILRMIKCFCHHQC